MGAAVAVRPLVASSAGAEQPCRRGEYRDLGGDRGCGGLRREGEEQKRGAGVLGFRRQEGADLAVERLRVREVGADLDECFTAGLSTIF